jgi:hypothetical protein
MHQTQQLEEPEVKLTYPEQTRTTDTNTQHLLDTDIDATQNSSQHMHLGNVVKRDRNRRMLVMSALPLLPFAALGALRALLSTDDWISLCSNPVFVITSVAACVAVPLWSLKPSKRARKATKKLASVNDLSAIGSMVDVLIYSDDPRSNTHVKNALIRLLPQLRATDAHLLSSRQMQMLQSILGASSFTSGDLLANPIKKIRMHARLQIAVLKAFEQIGDEAVLSGVQHARDHGATREVKRAAAECLPYIRQRAELSKASKTLLRASSSGAADTCMLVRAVDNPSATSSDEMLRPSTGSLSDSA